MIFMSVMVMANVCGYKHIYDNDVEKTKIVLDGMTRLSSKMEGQSDFNLEEICNKSQWSSGSRQEGPKIQNNLKNTNVVSGNNSLWCHNLFAFLKWQYKNHCHITFFKLSKSQRSFSCPFDILNVNIGNNDDDKRQQMNRNLVDETKR